MTQNPPPTTGMSSYDTKSASSENPSHCELLSRARGRRHQEDGALNPAMAQITLTPGQNRPKSITNNMNNSIDEIGQTFNHMRIRNRHRSTSLDRDTRNGQRSLHPRERNRQRSPSCTQQEQGQDQQAKRHSKELSRPGSQEQDPNTTPSDPPLAIPPRNRVKISVQKPAHRQFFVPRRRNK